jgi:hypothetical protein
MVYDLVYKFYEETVDTHFPSSRDMINALAKYLASVHPKEQVVVVTKHKHDAWWIETIKTGSCTYHFNDYQHWLGDRTEEEGALAIKAIFAGLELEAT